LKKPRPENAVVRRDKAVRLIEDDRMHVARS
jgi:hypothetical protein